MNDRNSVAITGLVASLSSLGFALRSSIERITAAETAMAKLKSCMPSADALKKAEAEIKRRQKALSATCERQDFTTVATGVFNDYLAERWKP